MEETNITYKELHEQFMSGHNGTSVSEVSTTFLLTVASVFARDTSVQLFGIHHSNGWIAFLIKLLYDFLCLVMPIQLAVTVLNQICLPLFLTMTSIGLICSAILYFSSTRTDSMSSFLNTKLDKTRPFITNYRATVNICSAIVILAVDFTILPRRFAKTELYGTGVMDTGVGCFVFCNAIVSPEARGKLPTASFFKGILKSVTSSLPLIVIGMVRVLATKGTDYHEHDTEYGTHWNFFFTLAAVKILATILFYLLPWQQWALTATGLILVYQYMLSALGFGNYIRWGQDGSGGRHGLWDANREGIYSCLGYLSIYFYGIEAGKHLFYQRDTVSQWLRVLMGICISCTISWVLLSFTVLHVELVSRRYANLSFVVWMVALNLLTVAGFLLADIMAEFTKFCKVEKPLNKDKKEAAPAQCLLAAVSHNGLFYFLLANLLTGLVNMSIQTMYSSPLQASVILTIYMLLLSCTVAILYTYKITVKFW